VFARSSAPTATVHGRTHTFGLLTAELKEASVFKWNAHDEAADDDAFVNNGLTPGALASRAELASHPDIQCELRRWWQTATDTVQTVLLFRQDFIRTMMLVSRVLLPDLDEAKEADAVADDWTDEFGTEDTVNGATFSARLFDICDLWTGASVGAPAYAAFLRMLHDRIAYTTDQGETWLFNDAQTVTYWDRAATDDGFVPEGMEGVVTATTTTPRGAPHPTASQRCLSAGSVVPQR